MIITTLKWFIQWLHSAQHTRLASPSPNPTGMSRLHAIPLERLDIGDWWRRWMLEKYRITWRKPKPETLIMSLYISNNQEVLFMLSVQKMRVINQPFHNQYPDTELKTVWTHEQYLLWRVLFLGCNGTPWKQWVRDKCVSKVCPGNFHLNVLQ